MASFFLVLYVLAAIVAALCWLITLVKIFNESGALLGAMCFCVPLVAYILGWMRCEADDNKPTMVIWTIAILLATVFRVAVELLSRGSP